LTKHTLLFAEVSFQKNLEDDQIISKITIKGERANKAQKKDVEMKN
jgi:hypothetical protein